MKHSTPGQDWFQSTLEIQALKQATMSVLVVDDEPGILDLLQTALPEFENCHVSVADSAATALKQIKDAETPFDCLLLDIQMPETNGLELLRHVRTIPGYAETPAIMLTAMNDRQHVEEAFLEGAFDYVTKPFDLFELRSRMNAAHLLMMERIRTQTSSASIRTLREELDFSQQFNFEDPLSIDGLERCLRYVEFDNYVQQLSRGRLFDSWVSAVKLQDADYRFDLNDFSGFRRVISDIGYCIENTSRDAGAVFSYRGGGIFLVVTHGRDHTDMLPSEEVLSRKLGMVLSARGASPHLRTVMSVPVSMRALSKTGAGAALNAAVEHVNHRELELRKGTTPQVYTGSDFEAEQRRKASPRLFETVMRELYGDKTYFARR
ncbi:response regulator [Ruegeria sp.]|uniref:response regulator n=1 Tax=Ruegeria sp. TaxID=1879320 RepID=UPI0023261F8B|nr:response regulator [Ruegeria sp.]MDA7963149.1 response regulator [Ruegeria sp.]